MALPASPFLTYLLGRIAHVRRRFNEGNMESLETATGSVDRQLEDAMISGTPPTGPVLQKYKDAIKTLESIERFASAPAPDRPSIEMAVLELERKFGIGEPGAAAVGARGINALASTSKQGVRGALPKLDPDTAGRVMSMLSGEEYAGRSQGAHLSAAKAKAGIVGGPGGQTGPGRRRKTRKGKKGKKRTTRRR